MTSKATFAYEATQAALVDAEAWRAVAEETRRATPLADHSALMAALREEHTAWCLARTLRHALAELAAP